MRVMVVGDPHGKVSERQDFASFLDQLLKRVQEEKPDRLWILGDLFDTFAVIRSEIMSLWTRFIIEAGKITKIVLLVGNHDMAGESGGSHALEAFRHFPNVLVVGELAQASSYLIETVDGIQYHAMPFMRFNEEFEQKARSIPAGSVLICHQSFNGCQFQNGFYDPHGADPACVAHLRAVIAGHIHLLQKIGNIWFPGTPRQMSFADEGMPKHAFIISLGNQGYTVEKTVSFTLPIYNVIKADSIEQALRVVGGYLDLMSGDLHRQSIKIVASGTPQEIAAFWADPQVRELRSLARRVVDALTPIKVTEILPGTEGMTPREKLSEFIRSRKWRSNPETIIAHATQHFGTE